MPSMISRSKLLLLSAFAVMGLILHLACGGGAKATVPGPPPLTMTVEAPGEGVVVSSPALHVRGQVSQPTATVAVNRQPIAVRTDGRFETDVNLTDGANTLTFEAWTEATVREGRGSGLLPPSEKAEARVIRTVTYQRGPILLTVSAPQDGATFSTSSIQTSGVVSESDATLTINGNAVPLNASGAFSTTLTLAVGSNTFTYLATGAGPGNRTATATRTVTYTPPPPPEGPTVTLTEPIEGTLTNAAQVRVSGTVSDPTATLTVNGQGTSMDAQGAFTSLLSPPEGPLTITALATNAAGKTGSDTRHIIIDRTPPRITLTKPVPALVNSKTLELIGNVDDPTAVLSLNNQGIALDASGNFHAFYGLSEGANRLAFRAVDPAGNVGTLDVDTVCDTTPPIITFEVPQDGFTTGDVRINVIGSVDDPSASLILQGQATPLDASGHFTTVVNASKEGPLKISAEATDLAGNVGRNARYVRVEFTPPVLAWADPTPAEGAQLMTTVIPAAVLVSKAAITSINNSRADLEPSENPAMPFKAATELTVQEGHVVLTATAVDGAGNRATITRNLDVGFTTPRLYLESPTLDASNRFTTSNVGVTLTGRVEAPDAVEPLTFTVNGQVTALTPDSRFSVPMNLVVGENPAQLVATSRFGQSDSKALVIVRTSGVPDPDPTTLPGIAIDWPQDGFASGVAGITVKGRVLVPGMSATLNGSSVAVDSQSLVFTGSVTLVPGSNTIQALGTDSQGRTATASVNGTYLPPGSASYVWITPVDGTHVKTRSVAITGKADQPGILSITINGLPMTLDPTAGTFYGSVDLPVQGRNALLLEAKTLAGDTKQERREVIFEPELPRIRLLAPDTARPGDLIPVQVLPEVGTQLLKADLSWNGRFLATVTDPFAAVQAQVPSDAAVGSKILVEALGTDNQGATITARAYVTVYTAGALVVEAYDDRMGLPLKDGSASVEGGETQSLDAHGRAALATALPQNWIKVTKTGYTPVWRSASVNVGGVQAVVDARLTPLSTVQSADASGFTGNFADGALTLNLPAGALSGACQASVTPLSSQGLPALLPMGWSAVSAWWLQADGATLQTAGSFALTLPTATPALPDDARFAWVRWDETQHAWMTLAVGLSASDLANLAVPAVGGYALVLADSGLTAPPAPVAASPLQGFEGASWRDGVKAAGNVDPTLMPTVDAIRGARITAAFQLDFDHLSGLTNRTGSAGDGPAGASATDGASQGADPLPSGVLIQTDVLESYLMVDQALIEPDVFTQDAVVSRWMLEVVNGKPALTGAGDGLGMRLPVRMSRTLNASELVEGRIAVGFYHDGVQVASSGQELLGAAGGTLSRDGVNLSFASGSLAGTTLVRLAVDPGDASSLWPELAGKGSLAKSFTVDIVGTLVAGLNLSVDALSVSDTARPLLLQRRVVQGERLLVAVGELTKQGTLWQLLTPTGGNPILEGGSFAVLVPTQSWDWISGTALLPGSMAQPLMQKLGVKARMAFVEKLSKPAMNTMNRDGKSKDEKQKAGTPSSSSLSVIAVNRRSSPANSSLSFSPDTDVAVADVVVDGAYIQAVSGTTGAFAVPAFIPADSTQTLQVNGTRRDLGVTGSFSATVPSQGNTLRMATVPFRVETTVPAQGATASVGTVCLLMTSGPADPTTITNVKLFKEVASNLVETSVRHSLTQDGKTVILTPDNPLELGSTYHLIAEGLAGLNGDIAPKVETVFATAAVVPLPPVDLSRIKLSYPDENFNVTITIPEGAIPPFASISVEAPNMGSVFTGAMNTSGDLTFILKANLGERLKIRVQLKDGRVFDGYLSRYESNDGSGRVTLGADGGRVDSPDGKAAATFPDGALDGPAEIRIEFTSEVPTELDPALTAQGTITGRVRLSADREVKLNKRPIVEMKAPDNPSTVQHSDGVGAYALFDRVEGFEDDGTPCVYFEMSDTAAFVDGKLKSMGGLPTQITAPAPGTEAIKGMTTINRAMGPGRAYRSSQKIESGSAKSLNSKSLVANAPRTENFFGGLFGAFLDMFTIDSGPHYISGFADISIAFGEAKPANGAYLYFSNSGGIKRGGQMLGRTLPPMGSYIFASFLTDELVRGGGQVMGIDADFGARAFSGSSYGGPGGIFGTYYHMPTLHFDVDTSQLQDHQPPYMEVSFEAKDANGSTRAIQDVASVGDDLYVVIKARDNKSPVDRLFLDAQVDNVPLPRCHATCQDSPAQSVGTDRGLYKFSYSLGSMSEGRHIVSATAFDSNCNKTQVSKDLTLMSFGEEPASVAGAPTAKLVVQGDLASVRTDTTIRVKFSEPVKGISTDSLLLERLDGGFVAETVKLYGRLGEVSPTHRIAEVLLQTSARLKTGTTYQVRWTGAIKDEEGLNPTGGPLQFTTTSYLQYPILTLPSGRIADVAAVGNMVYVGIDEKIQAWIYEGGDWMPQGQVGADGNGGFFNQDLVRVRAFSDVSLGNGERGSLLLVTTTPRDSQSNYQNVLWGFKACGAPELLFAVSLGQGAFAYSPSVDCRDGVIAVGRLTSSVAVIDIPTAIQGWKDWLAASGNDISMVRLPGGANQASIIQPFYLMDPEGTAVPANWGVGLLPTASQSSTGTGVKIAVTVGFLTSDLRGMPNFIQESPYNIWVPQPPFVGPSGGVDQRAVACPLTGGRGVTRLAVVPGVEITDADGSNVRTTNLAVGLSSSTRLYIVDEGDPSHPVELGYWDAPGTILYRMSAVDEISKWIALPVTKPEGVVWHILSLRVPSKPTVIAELKGLGVTGVMSYGVLYTLGNGQLSAVDFTQQGQVNAQRMAFQSYLRTTINPNLSDVQKVAVMAEAVGRVKAAAPANAQSKNCPIHTIKLDFVTINQGVRRYLRDSDLLIDNTYKVYREWKDRVPKVARKPMRLGINLSQVAVTAGGAPIPVKVKIHIFGPPSSGSQTQNVDLYVSPEVTFTPPTTINDFNETSAARCVFFDLKDGTELFLSPKAKLQVDITPVVPSGGNAVVPKIVNAYKTPQSMGLKTTRRLEVLLVPVDYVDKTGAKLTPTDADLQLAQADYQSIVQNFIPVSYQNDRGASNYSVQILKNDKFKFQWTEQSDGSRLGFEAFMNNMEVQVKGDAALRPILQKPGTYVVVVGLIKAKDQTTHGRPADKPIAGLGHIGHMSDQGQFTLVPGRPGQSVAGGGWLWQLDKMYSMAFVYTDEPDHFKREDNFAARYHELGHTLGSQHAPFNDLGCTDGFTRDSYWVSGTMNQSGKPYQDGRIGVTGLGFVTPPWRPGVGSSSDIPLTDRDIMSYTNAKQQWASDYDFAVWATLLQGQVILNLNKTKLAVPPYSSELSAPPCLSYPAAPGGTVTWKEGQAIPVLEPMVIKSASSYQILPNSGSLPQGVVLNPSTGKISGTPTTPQAPASVQIQAQNASGWGPAVTLNYSVCGSLKTLTYPSPVSLKVGQPMTPLSPTLTGGASGQDVAYYGNFPNGSGLVVIYNTGEITGTPTAALASGDYTITADNGCSQATFILKVTITQ